MQYLAIRFLRPPAHTARHIILGQRADPTAETTEGGHNGYVQPDEMANCGPKRCTLSHRNSPISRWGVGKAAEDRLEETKRGRAVLCTRLGGKKQTFNGGRGATNAYTGWVNYTRNLGNTCEITIKYSECTHIHYDPETKPSIICCTGPPAPSGRCAHVTAPSGTTGARRQPAAGPRLARPPQGSGRGRVPVGTLRRGRSIYKRVVSAWVEPRGGETVLAGGSNHGQPKTQKTE